jgi:hypothetical protein
VAHLRRVIVGAAVLESHLAFAFRILVLALHAALSRSPRQDLHLRIEHVENGAPALGQMSAYAREQRRLRRVVAQVLHRVECREDERKPPPQIKVTAIALDELDLDPRRLRLRARMRQHRRGNIEADDLDATLRDGNRQPAGTARQLKNRTAGSPRLFHVKRNVGNQKTVQRVVVPPIAVERDTHSSRPPKSATSGNPVRLPRIGLQTLKPCSLFIAHIHA